MSDTQTLISREDINSLLNAACSDVFGVLGLHQLQSGQFVVRCYCPDADTVEVISSDSAAGALAQLVPVRDGIFVGTIAASKRFDYKLKVSFGDWTEVREDCYRFGSSISETDLYLFGEGTHERLYEWMGSHECELDGVCGTRFVVWAPNAMCVSVVGVFNFWDGRHHMMRKHVPSGVWELFIPGVSSNALYKYEIKNSQGESLPQKSDPFAFFAEQSPGTASKVVTDNYAWGDGTWLAERGQYNNLQTAVSVYEVHLGSWRRVVEEGDRYLSYRELAAELVPYVKELGFTHIQLMPISEFPFDGSWGYQPIGLFAPTSRFGSPSDFKYFIDCCHQAQLGVLIDWVPGHFPSDAHGLACFDGTPLYEHSDPKQGFHPDWNTYIYNYGRCEVANFLYSNALFWFEQYHIDGLRVDAVASMLYLDYSREQGQWVPNHMGGRENLEAIDLIKRVNQKVYERFPDVMMVAEESTAWPGVSHPVYAGGLGFGYKWNMGWMNDSLRFMSNDPVHRKYHHHDLTFSLLYAFNENFVLPLSHDEVVHGKKSLLDKMPGNAHEKFANLRAYYGFMWTHPGKKLLFMGGEFAQGREWNHDQSLDWHLLDVPFHGGMKRLVTDLNAFYKSHPALYQLDSSAEGFQWVEADDAHNSVFAFLRHSSEGEILLVVCNMTPVLRDAYRLGVPNPGFYCECINSDASLYGGGDQGNAGGVQADKAPSHGHNWSVNLCLPPLATLIFEWQP